MIKNKTDSQKDSNNEWIVLKISSSMTRYTVYIISFSRRIEGCKKQTTLSDKNDTKNGIKNIYQSKTPNSFYCHLIREKFTPIPWKKYYYFFFYTYKDISVISNQFFIRDKQNASKKVHIRAYIQNMIKIGFWFL